MKVLAFAAATLAFAAVVNPSPASAAALNGTGNAWQGNPSVAGGASPGSVARAPHYEWQYHYAGRHPRLDGHWVLVR